MGMVKNESFSLPASLGEGARARRVLAADSCADLASFADAFLA